MNKDNTKLVMKHYELYDVSEELEKIPKPIYKKVNTHLFLDIESYDILLSTIGMRLER